MRIFRKSKSITIILIVLFLVYTTPVSALTRDDIVDFAKDKVGSHYLFGAHGNKYKNDFSKAGGREPEGLFWDDKDRYWKFGTTKAVWDKHSNNAYVYRTGTKGNYRYWDNCQGYGGGTRTNCLDVAHYDCIGLVDASYRNAGVYTGLVWEVSNKYKTGWLSTKHKTDVKKEHLQPGDLGYVGKGHIGIYVGNGQFVHANGHDRGVVCDSADGYNKWTRFGRALPSPLIQTVTVTSDQSDYLDCPALKPDELRGSNFNELGTCRFAPKPQKITVSVTWDGGESNAKKNSWRYSPCFGYLGSDWIEVEDSDEPVKYEKEIDIGHLTDSDLEIQVRNEYGSIDTINIHFETEDSIGVFVIKPSGFVQEVNRITHKNLSWTFWAECNNAYRSKSGEAVPPNEVSDINEAIDILGWEEGGEFMKIDGHDAYCIEKIRQYSGIDQIHLIDWSQEPCRSEALLMSPPESSGLFSRCDVIDAHYSSVFSSFPDWLNDVAYSGDTSVYFPIDVTMHYRYQDLVFDAMDKSTERGLISKAEAEFSIAHYVPHLSFTSVSKNVLVFLKDEGWFKIHYHGASFFEDDLDVLDEMLRSVKIGWNSEIPMDQRQYMYRLCTIAITPPATSQQQPTPSSSSKLKGSTVIPYQATGYKFKVFSLGEVPENFGAPDFNDFDFLIRDAAFGSEGDLCPLQSTIKTFWPMDSEIVLRKSFLLPANASNLRVLVAIDNDVQVLINGVDISNGLVTHENCPILDEFLFEVPDSILQEGENLLAVRARDRGVESYVDLRVLVDGDGDILPASLGHSFWDYVVMFGGGGCDEVTGPVGTDGRLIDQLLEANERITGSIFRGLMGRDITGTTGIRNDTNGDGEYDVVYADTNDDGNINVLAIDTNYYGLLDVWCFDTNGDGKIDVIERDANDDGTIEAMNIDRNYDGIADVSQRDTDGDGYLDSELSDDDFDATCDNINPMYQPCPPAKTLSEDENEIGGFEVTSVIAGILGVVYLLRRRK